MDIKSKGLNSIFVVRNAQYTHWSTTQLSLARIAFRSPIKEREKKGLSGKRRIVFSGPFTTRSIVTG